MKEYQDLIGNIIIAIAIVIAGYLIAQAGLEIADKLFPLGELIRDGLLQIGPVS